MAILRQPLVKEQNDNFRNRANRFFAPFFGLSAKMAILVVVGTIAMIGLFAYLGTAALSENTQKNLQERVVLAQMTASYIDALLDNIDNVLTHTAEEEAWTDPARANDALDRAYHRLGMFASRVFLTDNTGKVLATQPPISSTLTLREVTPVIAVLNGNPFAVSHVAQPIGSLGSFVVAATPLHDPAGKVTGALVIALDFNNPNIRAFTHPIGLGKTGYMDLVTQDGFILASTRAGRVGSQSDHESSLMGMIRDHRQAVSACHDCHIESTGTVQLAEVLAFAPLEDAQWGITVRQSESEVFESTQLLQSRIFALMLVMVVGALILVLITTRNVIVPVQELTKATQRIAEGDWDSPIGTRARDEVGVLARSFDEMRLRLKKSSEEIQAWNRELDARVQDRTAALEAAARENARLYAELSRKEQSRGELLRRVISAQEDERKRIARELHDETSQSLSALMVGTDAAQMAATHDPQKVHAHLTTCRSIAENLLKNIHRLIADLRPSLLDDLGLIPAIGWYGEQRLQPLGIGFHLDEHGFKTRIPPSMETALFRITQEAITNIVRHSHASQVTVQFLRDNGWVTLKICDDGQGFDPLTLQPTEGQGLGLRGMQERTSILGGEFALQTAPGLGTMLTIHVPILKEEVSHGETTRATSG